VVWHSYILDKQHQRKKRQGSSIATETDPSVPAVSHPQLLKSSSKQSITASEDFYSLSESGNEDETGAHPKHHYRHTYPEFSHLQEEDDPNLRTPTRNISPFDDSHTSQQSVVFSTPPSRINSPSAEYEATQAVETQNRAPPPAVLGLSFDKHLRRKPVSSASTDTTCASPSHADTKFVGGELSRQVTVVRRSRDNDASTLDLDKMDRRNVVGRTATPGVDDMPYIRFAIDQLTRDEEVRGSRDYEDDDNEPIIAPPMPVATGYPHAQRPEQSSRKAIPFVAPAARPVVKSQALCEATEQQRRSYPWKRSSRASEQPLGNTVLGTKAEPTPKHQPQRYQTPPAVVPTAHYDPASSISQFDIFMPYENHSPSAETPSLTFLPTILRPLWMGLYIFLCVLMLIGLIFSGAWSKKHNGLWAYKSFGDNRYFTFHYLPTLFGMIIVLWLIQIQIALQRIAPFIAMSSESTVTRSQAAFLDLYPTQYLYPKMQYFRSRQWVIGTCFVVFWMFFITIPLLSASFNARWIGDVSTGAWHWVAVQGVVWTVVVLYILLIICLVVLVVYLRRNQTGLKWDPRSMADIIALLERANIMSDYIDSEVFATKGQFAQRLWTRTDRLGYWHTSRRPQDIFYGIGAEGGAARRYSLEHGRIREKRPYAHSQQSSLSSLQQGNNSQLEHGLDARNDLRNTSVIKRHVPWMLTTVALLAFAVIAIALLIAFFVVSFVRNATTTGFFPSIRASADKDGFSPANFLFSFLSSLLGLVLFLLWQPLDFAVRRMAAFSALSRPDGALAAGSILLDYPALYPVQCTIRAVLNRDFLVAFTSFISLISPVIPILAGGVFWAQYYPDNSYVKVSAEHSGWYALCFFLAVYAVSFVALFAIALVRRGLVPALPHPALCLAELLSWVYMSPLATDPIFARAPSKQALVARLAATDPGSRTTTHSSTREKPSAAHNQFPTQGGSPPRLTVRLLGDHSSSDSDGFGAQHNRVPGHVTDSPRHSTSTHSMSADSAGQHVTRPLPPLTRPAGPLRFAFGVYLGRDGQEHLGIDRVVRDGREMVITNDTGKSSWIWR
jgi:hypothetical protein